MKNTNLPTIRIGAILLSTIAVIMGASVAHAQRYSRTGEEILRLPPGQNITSQNPQLERDKTFDEGLLALAANDYETAEFKFEKVLRDHRRHPQLNYYMALAKLGLEKMDESVKYLKRAVRYDKYYVVARETLALVEIDLGNPDGAAEQLEALQKLRPKCSSTPKCDEARLEVAISKVSAALA